MQPNGTTNTAAPAALPKGLKVLIDQGEHETLDFKKEVTSEIKIAKTMVSFANHKGGRLLIGVNDNGTISGIAVDEEKYMLERAAAFFCKPEIKLEIRQWQIGKKFVLEVTIPPGTDKPYYSLGDDNKWWAYIRVQDQSLLASRIVLDVLKKGPEGALVKFTSKEQALLDHLKAHHKITMKQFCSLVNISRRRAAGILVELIRMGIIRENQTEKPEYYTLS
jgi:predicted HTH transcriptional regulator